jgi:hypothetical protein
MLKDNAILSLYGLALSILPYSCARVDSPDSVVNFFGDQADFLISRESCEYKRCERFAVQIHLSAMNKLICSQSDILAVANNVRITCVHFLDF